MNNLFSKIKYLAGFCAIASVSMTSCVNDEYDLSKGLDMDMQLLQGTSLPLGNVAPVSIKDLLGGTGSESSFISEDESGNLSFSFFKDELNQSFQMPEVRLDGDGGIMAEDAEARFYIYPAYRTMPGNELSEQLIADFGSDIIYYSEEGITHDPNESLLLKAINVDMDKELPEKVISVRNIDMNARLNFLFTVTEGSVIHIAEGLVIDFPDYMVLVPSVNDSRYKVIDGHNVVFQQDVIITKETPFHLPFRFTSLKNIEGMVKEKINADGQTVRHLDSNEDIVVAGQIYVKASDYGDALIPEEPKMNMEVSLTDLYMTSAELIIDMDLQIEDKSVDVDGLPEFLTAEGSVLDLYNPILRFAIDNDSPLELNLNAEITALAGSHVTDIHVGDNCKNGNHETEPVVIPAESQVEYYLSRQGKHDTSSGEDIEVSEIADIISEAPDQITIHDIYIESERSYITVAAEEEYFVYMEYEFFSPLAFGEDLNLAFDYDIDLGLGGDAVGIDSLIISMDMVNTIPLNFTIKGSVLDSKGNELENASVDLDCALLAGTVDNPAASPVKVVVSTGNSDIDLSMLRLKLNATSSHELMGEVLNTAQGLAINGINVSLPQGVKLDLTNYED